MKEKLDLSKNLFTISDEKISLYDVISKDRVENAKQWIKNYEKGEKIIFIPNHIKKYLRINDGYYNLWDPCFQCGEVFLVQSEMGGVLSGRTCASIKDILELCLEQKINIELKEFNFEKDFSKLTLLEKELAERFFQKMEQKRKLKYIRVNQDDFEDRSLGIFSEYFECEGEYLPRSLFVKITKVSGMSNCFKLFTEGGFEFKCTDLKKEAELNERKHIIEATIKKEYSFIDFYFDYDFLASYKKILNYKELINKKINIYKHENDKPCVLYNLFLSTSSSVVKTHCNMCEEELEVVFEKGKFFNNYNPSSWIDKWLYDYFWRVGG